jgi:acetolactate synthase-1/2/3 large subunit
MNLRHYAGQDCDIISMVKPITKYAYEITKISEIPIILEEAIKHMINGRPGPVWISVPVDIQGYYFLNSPEISLLQKECLTTIPTNIEINNLKEIRNIIKKSERPIIIAGNGIKMGQCILKFRNFLNIYNIPVVVSFHGTDLIEYDDKLFVGKVGLIGDRTGNFAMQNSDLLIVLGCRMAQGIVGYNKDTFARNAKIVYIDNDQNEIEKDNINYTKKINMDLNTFFDEMNKYSNENINENIKNFDKWIIKCNYWKNKWSYELPSDLSDEKGINPYYALNILK